MKLARLTGIATILAMLLLLSAGCNKQQSTESGSAATSGTTTVAQVYTCPMHPEVQQDQPGQCPICGMDLVVKE